jgi:hypothetical protein
VVDLWKDTGETLKALAGTWGAAAALGGVVLYLVGYLSLRFHVTTLGLVTDLAILDERYLFAGAQFLVYLVLAVPIVVLIGLVVSALAYAPYRLIAARRGMKPGDAVEGRWQGLRLWWAAPHRLALTGIVVSVAMIQLVMRQCLVFRNLLLAEELPSPAWLQELLLAGEGLQSLYFTGLLAATAGTAGLLLWAWSRPEQTSLSRALSRLLAVLVAVQGLMLPVNYGILLAYKTLPKVANVGDTGDIPQGQAAWLVWEGKDSITYLLRKRVPDKEEVRELVTLPRSKVDQIRIIDYNRILRVLFAESGRGEHQPSHASP